MVGGDDVGPGGEGFGERVLDVQGEALRGDVFVVHGEFFGVVAHETGDFRGVVGGVRVSAAGVDFHEVEADGAFGDFC